MYFKNNCLLTKTVVGLEVLTRKEYEGFHKKKNMIIWIWSLTVRHKMSSRGVNKTQYINEGLG